MSKKIKSQKITFRSLIRLIIFIVIIYFSINWLSHQKQTKSIFFNPPVLSDQQNNNFLANLYQKLPGDSRYQLEHFNQNKINLWFQDKWQYLQQQLNGFPSRQIKEIQKGIIKNVSDGMIKNIDQK